MESVSVLGVLQEGCLLLKGWITVITWLGVLVWESAL
jgi:hypothetical protein